MKITFLAAEVPLTKTFNLENGEIVKVGHPKIVDYTSYQHDVKSLAQFLAHLTDHSSKGHCLLKGNVTRALTNESRAGTTNPNEPTSWMCLDLDGLVHINTVEQFMASVGLGDVSYIVQYSASMGVLPGKGLSAHVFVQLDREYLPDILKLWLKGKNFNVPGLESNLSLTRTGNALRWALDVTTCQADKLIYIAPPLLGAGVEDKFEGARIQLVEKARSLATLDAALPPEVLRGMEQRKLDALRTAKGLEKKKWDRAKTTHGVTWMPDPDVSAVSGIREERGFVYLNLNDGDSWGYWHPRDNPEFIRNFKGEPVYRTKDLLPDYYAAVQRDRRAELRADDLQYLAFRDFDGSTYYNGTWDEANGKLRLAAAKGEQQIRDYLTEHGQPNPEVIPTWTMVYDPNDPRRVDAEAKWLNTYQPSDYELRYAKEPTKVEALPEVTRKVWLHALGGSEECLEHFCNWVACIIQLKVVTETAWFVQGVQGTGKGVMFNQYLCPMLGPDNVIEKRMEEFESEFNGFLDGKLLVFVDEAQMEESRRAKILENTFKNMITEPRTSVRHMRQMHRMVKSFLNFIIASNKHGIRVDDTDRRYNVAPYQDDPLPKPDDAMMQAIHESVWPTYCYLRTRKADQLLARKALANEAKKKLADLSKNSIQATCDALRTGDLQFFVDQVQTSTDGLHGHEQDAAIQYRDLVTKMAEYKALFREELLMLFTWTVGENVPRGSVKFANMLKQNRLDMKKVRRAEKTNTGVSVAWRTTE